MGAIIMIDSSFILFGVIVVLVCLNVITSYNGIKEREKLLKMLMAKDLKEVTDNEYTEKIIPKETPPSEFVELTPDDETMFDRAIREEVKNAEHLSRSPR